MSIFPSTPIFPDLPSLPNISIPGANQTPPNQAPASPPPPTEDPCPCKQKMSDGEKSVIDFGLVNSILNDPNAAAVGAIKELGGQNSNRLLGMMDTLAPGGVIDPLNPLGALMPKFQGMRNKIDSMQNVVAAFEAESKRLTNPQELIKSIGTLGLFSELNCALGIEGLDISGGLSVIGADGQLSLSYGLNANVDVERVLNQIDSELGGALGDATQAGGAAIQSAMEGIQAGMNEAFSKLDQADAAIGGVLQAANDIQNQAADFLQKITNINMITDLIKTSDEDSCFKLGAIAKANLVSPGFLNTVRTGLPSIPGTSIR